MREPEGKEDGKEGGKGKEEEEEETRERKRRNSRKSFTWSAVPPAPLEALKGTITSTKERLRALNGSKRQHGRPGKEPRAFRKQLSRFW